MNMVPRCTRAVLPRCVEPSGDPDGTVGQDPPLDVAGGLVGANADDAEGAAALGDVEEDLLDRAVALARRVLVELVEDEHISGWAVPWRSLRANSPRMVTPTTNRCARSVRLCR